MLGLRLGFKVGLKVGFKLGFCVVVAFAKLRRQRTTRPKMSFIYAPEDEGHGNTN